MDVVEAVAPYGLMALHGSSPDVGVTGYSLGGGIGWYARELGLQTNQLTAVELVLPDGRFVRASEDEESGLFWALRGGGGNFGVVTTLEMRLHAIPTAYAGWLVWDWHEAHRVLTRWAEWAVDAPDEVTTSFRILQLPPIEEIPAPLRGRQIVAINGAVRADDKTAEQILAPLRELAPEMDTFTRMPAAELVRLHGDPEGPTHAVTASTMLGSLPAEAIDTFIDKVGAESGSSLMVAELRQLGGALARAAVGGGALSHLEGQFIAFAVGVPMGGPEVEKALAAEAESFIAALAPWRNGRQYSNFAEDSTDPASFYDRDVYERLRHIRAAVNPSGRVRANHAF
jgi:FAD/FMN-containing dehydrogenase